MIDSRTISLMKQGDPQAFESVYFQTHDKAYSVAYRILKDDYEAEDIVQDAYVTVIEKLDGLKETERFEAWFYRIVQNAAKDALRKRHAEVFSAYDNDEEDFQFSDTIVSDYAAFDPEASADYAELQRIMGSFVEGLPEMQRKCILLRFQEDKKISEIAQILGIPEPTVKSNLNYGKKKIEGEVRALEKQGVKLYSVTPLTIIPFLRWMWGRTGSARALAAFGTSGTVAAGAAATTAATAATTTAATTAAGTTAASATAATAASAAAKTGIIFSAKQLIAGIAAVAAITGGTTAAVKMDLIPPLTAIFSTQTVEETAPTVEFVIETTEPTEETTEEATEETTEEVTEEATEETTEEATEETTEEPTEEVTEAPTEAAKPTVKAPKLPARELAVFPRGEGEAEEPEAPVKPTVKAPKLPARELAVFPRGEGEAEEPETPAKPTGKRPNLPNRTLAVFGKGESAEPTENTKPTEPEETTPTEPEETTAPTEPEETTTPTVPEETTAPTEPEETTTPTVPEETTAPTEPEETTTPTVPEETTAPTEPEETTAPTESTTEPTEHTHRVKTRTQTPTCNSPGLEKKYCEVCGETISETVLPMTEHTMVLDYHEDANCTFRAYDQYKCTYCGKITSEEGTEFGPHEIFTEYVKDQPATCTSNGILSRTYCPICGVEISQEETPALGHQFSWAEFVKASCVKGAYYIDKCSICGTTRERITTPAEPDAHYFRYNTEIVQANCVEDGWYIDECVYCGFRQKGTVIPAHGHEETHTISKPTCTSAGRDRAYCMWCGLDFSTTEIPPTGHDYRLTAVEKAGETYTCANCGDSYTVSPALPEETDHEHITESIFNDNTCTDDGYSAEICTICGKVIEESTWPAYGHNYEQTEDYQAPTCTESGYTTLRCSNCGDTIRNTLPAAHSFTCGNGSACTDQTCHCTKCGTNHLPYLAGL